MRFFVKTDKGKTRTMNQDYYYVSESDLHLYILADGMGGYAGGEIASKLATSAAAEYLKENFKNIEYKKEEILELIENAMNYANKVVYEKSREVEELEQMGTTLEICLIYMGRAYIGHVGDSRIYRIRQGIMRKLTTDHSYVQKLVKDGTITKEEAEHHPRKNMLMQALGCDETFEPDIMVKGFLENDIILICSDGLTNMVSETEIHNIIKEDIETAAEKLIKKANESGGYDNISIIIIQN